MLTKIQTYHFRPSAMRSSKIEKMDQHKNMTNTIGHDMPMDEYFLNMSIIDAGMAMILELQREIQNYFNIPAIDRIIDKQTGHYNLIVQGWIERVDLIVKDVITAKDNLNMDTSSEKDLAQSIRSLKN